MKIAAMISGLAAAVAGVAGLTQQEYAPELPDAPCTDAETNAKLVERVAGEAIDEVAFRDGMFRSGPCVVDTKLPVGYPWPTAPGAIEIKRYPGVRRAEITVPGEPGDERASNFAFFPLFNHISRNDIAMTAPVEMDFGKADDGAGTATMSFLYEKPTDGGLDGGKGNVKVVDAEPVTVLSLGIRGRMNGERFREAIARLEGWVSGSADWVSLGDYRWLGYNGPNINPRDQWFEVQVYIKPADAGEDAAADASKP